ncbi:hypothetical protein GCM10010441_33030 [Kitasatospora paracochleata]
MAFRLMPPIRLKTYGGNMDTERTTKARGSKPTGDRRRHPVRKAVRNVGIVLDTAARVVFLGRDGVFKA